MSSYRQIRKQTRRARRAGLQPIVVIESPFPVPAAVLVARLAVALPLRGRARQHGGRRPRAGVVAPPRTPRSGGRGRLPHPT